MGKPIFKLPEDRSRLGLLLVTWVTYFSTYLGRLNFSACLSDMTVNGGFVKAELGSVAAAFFLSYGLGQILSGVLGDRLSPRLLVFGGVAGSALMNALFPACTSTAQMTVLWLLNGAAQAFIWAPMSRWIADLTTGTQYVRIILLLSTTGPAGMFGAYGACALLIGAYGWQSCFWLAFVALTAAAVLWLWSSRALERHARLQGAEEAATAIQQGTHKGRSPLREILSGSGLLWIGAAVCLHGLLKDGLTTWIPTYLSEEFRIESSFSVALTMILPISNLSGVYLVSRLNRRLENEAITSGVFFLAALAAVGAMLLMGGRSLAGTVLLFAVVTSSMLAVNTIFISIVPVHFRRHGAISTVSGALNATTYLGSALSSVLFGYMAETGGWQLTRLSWCAIAALGVVCCLVVGRKWKRFRQDIYSEDSVPDTE